MSDTAATRLRRRHRSRLWATLKALIRTRVTTGLIVILPIYVTWFVIKFVFSMMRDASQWVVLALLETKWFQSWIWRIETPPDETVNIEGFLSEHPGLDWGLALFSVLLTIIVLYIIGLFAANIFGRRILALVDHVVDRVPMVKTIYRGIKQVLSSFTGDQTQSFRRAALVPFPQEKMRCVGFITNIFNDSITGEELCSVFIATTPNPTTGYLQVIRRKDITELDWSVEDAIRTVMSGGILKPDFLTIVPNKDLPADRPSGVGPINLTPPAKADDEPPGEE